MIKNIIFDMGNVLMDYNPRRHVYELTKDDVLSDIFLREIFMSEEWKQFDRGVIDAEGLIKIVQARVPEHAEIIPMIINNWFNDLKPIEGMEELVNDLYSMGYKLYVLSNASVQFWTFTAGVEFFKKFDGILVSSDVKMIKPEKEIFLEMLNRFSLSADECIFIDDIEENVLSAMTLGIRAIRFENVKGLKAELLTIGVVTV